MGRLTIRLPNALHNQLETLAKQEGVSMNQYITYALTRHATLAQHAGSPPNHKDHTPEDRDGAHAQSPTSGASPPETRSD